MTIPNINYAGTVAPAVFLTFKGPDHVSGSHAAFDDSWLYQAANECITDWTINVNTGSANVTLQRSVTASKRRFSSALNTYLNNPVQTSVLNQIIDASNAGTLQMHITMKIWYHRFFRKLLEWMTRTQSEIQNIANPADANEILDTFSTSPSGGGHLNIIHKKEEKELIDIPCMLSGIDERPGSSGSAPTVKLYLYMKIRESLAGSSQTEALQCLIGADYTKIFKYGKIDNPWYGQSTAPTGIEVCLKTWESNLWNYLINFTDLKRGKKIRDQVADTSKNAYQPAISQTSFVAIVRNEIDNFLVTANAWHQPRENPATEALQFKLSELFAKICQTRWRASPVYFIRYLQDRLDTIRGPVAQISLEDQVCMTFQYGAGHCGEHCDAAFSILSMLMDGTPAIMALLKAVFSSGYANRDHAFVVGGLIPTEIHKLKARQADNSSFSVGEVFDAVDLEKAILDNGNVDGFVCDPYLESNIIGQTAKALLQQLKNYQNASKRTKYVTYYDIHPVQTPPIQVLDKTGTPAQGI